MKNKISDFELWLFGEFAEYTALHDIESFCKLLDNKPYLANEYYERRLKEIENIELLPEFFDKDYKDKMWAKFSQALEDQKSK